MKEWLKDLSRAKQIGLAVVCLHALAILSLSTHHLFTPPPKPTRIAVRTLSPPSTTTIAPPPQKKPSPAKTAAPPPAPSQKAEAKKPGAVATKPAAPKLGPSTPKSTPPPSPAPTVAPTHEPLPIATPSAPPRKPALLIPAPVIPKTVEMEIASDSSDPSYAETLVAYLQNSLELPEYGAVKMRLEFGPNGELLRSEVLEAHHAKNGEFLQKRLAELIFPSPPNRQTTSLVVTFKN